MKSRMSVVIFIFFLLAGGDLPTVRPRPPLSAAPCVSGRRSFEVSGGCNINVLDLKLA